MCRLRRVEPDDGGRVCRRRPVLRGRLPGVLQAEPPACSVRPRGARICDYGAVVIGIVAAKRQAKLPRLRMNSMTPSYGAPGRMVAHNMVTTQFELDGFRVVRTLGVVRGIVVRSRSIFGTIGASLQTILGGNITLLTNLCEKTRAEAFDLMLQHAAELGGNAVLGARYDATEVMQGVTEVLAYGTAVVVEPGSEMDAATSARDKQ